LEFSILNILFLKKLGKGKIQEGIANEVAPIR
jgi:hypothetical protein